MNRIQAALIGTVTIALASGFCESRSMAFHSRLYPAVHHLFAASKNLGIRCSNTVVHWMSLLHQKFAPGITPLVQPAHHAWIATVPQLIERFHLARVIHIAPFVLLAGIVFFVAKKLFSRPPPSKNHLSCSSTKTFRRFTGTL